MSTTNLQDTTIAFLVATEGIEQAELTGPWDATEQAGGTAVLISTEHGQVQAFNHFDPADSFDVDVVVDDADPRSTTAWCCPAGWATATTCAPPRLRSTSSDLRGVRKPVAAILARDLVAGRGRRRPRP